MSNEQPHRDGRTWWQRLVCVVRTRTLAGANVFREHDESSNRAALRRELDEAEIPVGLLAYVNDQPAGWTRVVPRRTLAGICGNGALQRVLDDDDSAWWVTCFAIRKEHRGLGVGRALLGAALADRLASALDADRGSR